MPVAASDVALVVAAVAAAAVGGELFLKGVIGVAHGLRIPKMLAATTLVAFATSSPEFTVSVVAAVAGSPEIGLGDALGSNVVNIGLIFGLALLAGPIRVARGELGRDFVLALFVPLFALWLAADGRLSRTEGGILLAVFAAWAAMAIHAGVSHRRTAGVPAEPVDGVRTVVRIVVGLATLVFAGHFFVAGATGIASALGVDAYVVGATVVALGTSLPELATVVFARLRGHDEIGVGTLIGSNLFNGLVIVGTSASIQAVRVPLAEVSTALLFGAGVLLLLIPNRSGVIPRSRGLALLAAYLAFLAATSLAAGAA